MKGRDYRAHNYLGWFLVSGYGRTLCREIRCHPGLGIYKPVSYLPNSSAVERILPSEVSPFTYYTLSYTYSYLTAFGAGL